MHPESIERWQHDHAFDQDKLQGGEKRLWLVVAITLATMVLEIGAGVLYGSIALLADGLHMGSHATALGIAAFAYAYAHRHAHDERFSFGTGKVNALGGFTGAVLLAVFALLMGLESIQRFINPVDIVFDNAIAVAVIGLIVNGVCACILAGGEPAAHGHHDGHSHAHHHHDHGHAKGHGHHDHNRRAAFYHVLADALTSLLAVVALLAAGLLGWNWMDPLMGIVGMVLVLRWSWQLLGDSGGVLLDRQAGDLAEKLRRLAQIRSGIRVSDLHVWSIAPDQYAVILSVVTDGPETSQVFQEAIRAKHPEIAHVTVQVDHCPDA